MEDWAEIRRLHRAEGMAIRALLAESPEMPTSVLMERVGWRRGRSVFYERVAALRPLFQPPDPVSRTAWMLG